MGEVWLTAALVASRPCLVCWRSIPDRRLAACASFWQDADIGDLFFDDAQFEALEKDFENVSPAPAASRKFARPARAL